MTTRALCRDLLAAAGFLHRPHEFRERRMRLDWTCAIISPNKEPSGKGRDRRACLRILALAVGGCRGPTLRAGPDLLPRDAGGGRAGGVPRILDLSHRRRSLGRPRVSRLRGLVPARWLLRAGPPQRGCRLRGTQEPARQGRRGVRRGRGRGPIRIRERRSP